MPPQISVASLTLREKIQGLTSHLKTRSLNNRISQGTDILLGLLCCFILHTVSQAAEQHEPVPQDMAVLFPLARTLENSTSWKLGVSQGLSHAPAALTGEGRAWFVFATQKLRAVDKHNSLLGGAC